MIEHRAPGEKPFVHSLHQPTQIFESTGIAAQAELTGCALHEVAKDSSVPRCRLTSHIVELVRADQNHTGERAVGFGAELVSHVRHFCDDPEAHGMPEWLHDRCVTFAKAQSLEYITPEQQSYVRALLFEEIAKVDSAAAEQERRTLARAVDDPNVARVFSQYVEVRDEDSRDFGDADPEEHAPVTHRSAVGHRKDAAEKTPRAKGQPTSKPVTMKRPTAPSSARAPSPAPAPRRTGRTTSKNAAPTGSGAHTQSADRPDQRAPASARSKRMKYGEVF